MAMKEEEKRPGRADSRRLTRVRHVALPGLTLNVEDNVRVREVLEGMIANCRARAALLVGRNGELVAHVGRVGYDLNILCAAISSYTAVARELARMFGEEEFSLMFPQGQKDQVQFTLVGDRANLAVLFDDHTMLGQVKVFSSEGAAEIGSIFEEITRRRKR